MLCFDDCMTNWRLSADINITIRKSFRKSIIDSYATSITIHKHLHQKMAPAPAIRPRWGILWIHSCDVSKETASIGHFSTADLKHIHSIDFEKDSSCKARVEAAKITIEINWISAPKCFNVQLRMPKIEPLGCHFVRLLPIPKTCRADLVLQWHRIRARIVAESQRRPNRHECLHMSTMHDVIPWW